MMDNHHLVCVTAVTLLSSSLCQATTLETAVTAVTAITAVTQAATLDDLDLWPLFTPMLGNISKECKSASEAYITHLSEVLADPGLAITSPDHRNALRRFDSNGPIPFLQEGQLQAWLNILPSPLKKNSNS